MMCTKALVGSVVVLMGFARACVGFSKLELTTFLGSSYVRDAACLSLKIPGDDNLSKVLCLSSRRWLCVDGYGDFFGETQFITPYPVRT